MTKRAKQFFQKHTNSDSKKCWEKNWGNKTRETIFPETHYKCEQKVGKKPSEKSAKNVFLYSHEYRDQKMGGKNAQNNFSRNIRIVRRKNVGKKIVGKKCEKRFFIFTRIS